jgi:hypothetical protein
MFGYRWVDLMFFLFDAYSVVCPVRRVIHSLIAYHYWSTFEDRLDQLLDICEWIPCLLHILYFVHWDSNPRKRFWERYLGQHYNNILIFGDCKITYFRWDFISHFCHIVSLQQCKIHVFGRVVIENPLNIFIFAGFISAIITHSWKSRVLFSRS